MNSQSILLITFGIYCLLLLIIACLAWRRTQSANDYILGGRKMGRWVSAISAGASDMSGWLLLGLPGYAYVAGLEAIWIAVGLFIGTALNWHFIAPRLRRETERAQNALTIPEFLEQFFQDKSHRLRIVSALFILVFYLFYTSAGLVAAGKLFETLFNIEYSTAVIIGTIIILLYTAFGGFLAVSWTDLFQGLLMFFALLMVVVMASYANGGMGNSLQLIETQNPFLLQALTDNAGEAIGLISIISLLSWGLGYFGQPHILARFMAIRSEADIPAAKTIALGWTGISLICAILIGLFGVILIQPALSETDSETVLLELLPILFHPVFASIVLAAILAAIMSTADSQLLVSGSVVTEDIFKLMGKQNITDQQILWVGRIAVIIMAMIACYLALSPDSKILELVAYAWAGFGAAFGPLLILMLYSKQVTNAAALIGIISGGLTVVIWKQLEGGWFDVYELFPAFLISFGLIIISSKLTQHQHA